MSLPHTPTSYRHYAFAPLFFRDIRHCHADRVLSNTPLLHNINNIEIGHCLRYAFSRFTPLALRRHYNNITTIIDIFATHVNTITASRHCWSLPQCLLSLLSSRPPSPFIARRHSPISEHAITATFNGRHQLDIIRAFVIEP